MNPDDYLSQLFQFLVILPAAILCFLPLRHQLKLKPAHTWLLVIGVLTVLIPLAALFTTFFSLQTNQVFFPLFVVFFVIYYHLVKSGLGETLSIFLQVMALFSFPADFALAYDARIHPTASLGDTCTACACFQFLLSLVFALLYGWFLYRFESSLIDRLSHARLWYATLPVPLAFLLLNVLIQPIHYQTLYAGRIFFLYLFLLFISLFLFTLTYVVFYFVAEELLNAAKTQEHVRLLEMQEHQYMAQQSYMEESRRIRHDFRQSLFMLASLAEAGDLQTLQQYLHTYVSSLPQNETTSYCSNLPVNALLNYYANRMTEHKISMKWEIELPPENTIPDNDLCGMLGNLLENILHGCCTVTDGERYCYLSILPRHSTSLYIVASNNFGNTLRQKGDTYFSTHKGGQGIGLSSICATAERYGGMAKFSHSGNEFYSDIVLRS